jgi:hypothetical protein
VSACPSLRGSGQSDNRIFVLPIYAGPESDQESDIRSGCDPIPATVRDWRWLW